MPDYRYAELTEAQIEAAIQWWADQLRGTTFDMGEEGREAEFSENVAAMTNKPQDEDRIERFSQALREIMVSGQPFRLHVDYDPCRTLREAAEQAGIKPGLTTFPWKTNMRFEDGGVQVSKGYGAAYEEILK